MKTNLITQKVIVPTVFVTKGRQRVKQYDNSVYLKSGDEFEIELFNPTSSKILAKITLNGKSLGSGIILRPGERVFLERYFDEAKKFLFETYSVDGNNPFVQDAIKLNGIVDVEFFNEYHANIFYASTSNVYYPLGQPYGGITYTSGTSKGIGCSTLTSNSANYFTSSVSNCSAQFSGNIEMSKEIETGRVEKGSQSSQSFTYDSTQFNSYYSWKSTWKILPESQKPFVAEDLRVFCTNCGLRKLKHLTIKIQRK